MHSVRALIVISVISATAAIVLPAQTPPAPSRPDQTPQTPIFRAGVEAVQLDITVIDKNRRPVRGLAEADFTVFEDGKPQKIVAFSAFDVNEAPPPPPVKWMRDIAPDVATNAVTEQRLWILLLDDAMIPGDAATVQEAKKDARSIIDKVGANDLMAVIFTGDNRGAQDFTNDKTKLLAALDTFKPGLVTYTFGYMNGTKTPDTDGHYYVSAARALRNVADYLISIPNKRKTLFWISPGIPFELAGTMPQQISAGSATDTGVSRADADVLASLSHEMSEAFRRAQRANVAIYPIDPTGLGTLAQYIDQQLRSVRGPMLGAAKATASQDFILAAASNTGGRAIVNTNDLEPGIQQIFAENESYYLLGFQPTNTKRDGTLRRIEVKVNRPGVEVHTRSGYYAPAAEKAEKPNDKAKTTPEAAALAKAIGGVLPNSDLPMRVTLAAFAVPGQRNGVVTITLGVREPIPAEAAASKITETTELLASAYTPEGDPRGSQRSTAKLTLRAGANGDAEFEVLGKIELAPGRYRLRLAAHNEAVVKSGSVFADVVMPDFTTDAFSMSGVVLEAVPGLPAAPKNVFTNILPIVPTSIRDFLVTDRVTAFLRLYQSGRKAFDRATVSIRIVDGHDVVKVTESQTIAADRFVGTVAEPAEPVRGIAPRTASRDVTGGSLRSADVRFPMPLTRLGPGPHLLTFEATVGGVTVRRDVRFSVK